MKTTTSEIVHLGSTNILHNLIENENRGINSKVRRRIQNKGN